VQRIHTVSGELLLFAGKATFSEWNLLCSFLLVPFSLALWAWADRGRWDRRSWIGLGLLAALLAGLVFGVTRAAWFAMAALVAIWWRVRRPSPVRVIALVAVTALAFVAQTSVVSLAKLQVGPAARGPAEGPGAVARPGWWASSPLASRIVMPVVRGYDWNMAGRASISRATLHSWRERPWLDACAGPPSRARRLRSRPRCRAHGRSANPHDRHNDAATHAPRTACELAWRVTLPKEPREESSCHECFTFLD
jgi:hypothetical protein